MDTDTTGIISSTAHSVLGGSRILTAFVKSFTLKHKAIFSAEIPAVIGWPTSWDLAEDKEET
jgi:hypothetical protein